jgi:hypothetical protein
MDPGSVYWLNHILQPNQSASLVLRCAHVGAQWKRIARRLQRLSQWPPNTDKSVKGRTQKKSIFLQSLTKSLHYAQYQPCHPSWLHSKQCLLFVCKWSDMLSALSSGQIALQFFAIARQEERCFWKLRSTQMRFFLLRVQVLALFPAIR